MYEPSKGMNIYSSIKELQENLIFCNRESETLLFNGVELLVNVKSIPYDLITIYELQMKLKRNNL